MSKHDKVIARMAATPTPSNIKWDELTGALKHLGYKQLKAKGGGSGRKFFHEEKDLLICCHEPHPDPNVDKGCIDAIVDHLKLHKLI